MGQEGTLSRWSRRKARARQGLPEAARPSDADAQVIAATPPDARATVQHAGRSAEPASTGRADTLASMPAAHATPAVQPDAEVAPAPTLDDVARLAADAPDFSRFVARDVQPEVRHAALKKLFSDPHFNRMDGLDVYIDDYGKPDPLPMAMLQKMAGNHFLGLLSEAPDTPPPTAGAAPASPPNADNAGGGAVDAAPPTVALGPKNLSDENTDLRLQPDDAAGRKGVAAGPGEEPLASH
jgi:hypothetical protein